MAIGLARLAPQNRYYWALLAFLPGRQNESTPEQPERKNRGENKMTAILNAIVKLKIWSDNRGQDLIEYALMAGFVAVAAGAIMPGIATSISTIFSSIASTMTAAAATS
jgi:pilus assembly protein Flp/PilA